MNNDNDDNIETETKAQCWELSLQLKQICMVFPPPPLPFSSYSRTPFSVHFLKCVERIKSWLWVHPEWPQSGMDALFPSLVI